MVIFEDMVGDGGYIAVHDDDAMTSITTAMTLLGIGTAYSGDAADTVQEADWVEDEDELEIVPDELIVQLDELLEAATPDLDKLGNVMNDIDIYWTQLSDDDDDDDDDHEDDD